MKSFKISRSCLTGTIRVPPSKSQTLRAFLFAALADGKSVIFDPLHSPDTLAMAGACQMIGAKIAVKKDRVEMEGTGGRFLNEGALFAGNSGIVLRFMTALAAVFGKRVEIEGDASLSRRPMQPLYEALGRLDCKEVTVLGEDSQFVSALLIALSFNGPKILTVKNPGEKPWVDMTLHWLNRLGAGIRNWAHEKYEVPGNLRYPGFVYRVPGDLSSAAFPIVAALATGSEILLRNIDLLDGQGDRKFIEQLGKMGAQIEIDPEAKMLRILKSSLSGCKADVNDYIDAVPALAAAACFAKGETVITGASVARTKECDRLAAIASELKKMGAAIDETGDGLRIIGSHLHGAKVLSFGDHRMALALSAAALGADGETTVENVECISKTYSTFKEDFVNMGAGIV